MTIDLALEKLIPGLQEIYGDLIDSVILYGSTARGTRTADSDVDVAILLRAGATKVMRDQMLDLVVDLELECGKVLSVLCIDYDKFAEWKGVLPFYKNIRRMVLFYGRQLNGTIRASLWSGQRRIANSGVIAHFNQEYVKTGVFEKGASKIIRNASELREQADYEDFYEATQEEASDVFMQASQFILEVECYLHSKSIL